MKTSRGPAVAASWIFREDESRRRRGCELDIPRGRGAAAATTWTFRGDESRRRRGCHVDRIVRELAGCGVDATLFQTLRIKRGGRRG